MGGQANVYKNALVFVNKLSTRGGWVVKKGIKSVYVVIECPLTTLITVLGSVTFATIFDSDYYSKKLYSFNFGTHD